MPLATVLKAISENQTLPDIRKSCPELSNEEVQETLGFLQTHDWATPSSNGVYWSLEKSIRQHAGKAPGELLAMDFAHYIAELDRNSFVLGNLFENMEEPVFQAALRILEGRDVITVIRNRGRAHKITIDPGALNNYLHDAIKTPLYVPPPNAPEQELRIEDSADSLTEVLLRDGQTNLSIVNTNKPLTVDTESHAVYLDDTPELAQIDAIRQRFPIKGTTEVRTPYYVPVTAEIEHITNGRGLFVFPKKTARRSMHILIVLNEAEKQGFSSVSYPLQREANLRRLLKHWPHESSIDRLVLTTPEASLVEKAREFADAMRPGYVPPDRPLFVSDGMPGRDSLGIDGQVDSFAKLMVAENVKPPLAIGLFGAWGSGKTFFMKSLRERVRTLTTQAEDKFVTRVAQIEFNAWQYVDANMWASFAVHIFDQLAEEIGETQETRQQLRNEVDSSKTAIERAQFVLEEAKEAQQKAIGRLRELEAKQAKQANEVGAARLQKLREEESFRKRLESVEDIARRLGITAESEDIKSTTQLQRISERLEKLRESGYLSFLAKELRKFRTIVPTLVIVGGVFGVGFLLPDVQAVFFEFVALLVAGLSWTGSKLSSVMNGLDALADVQERLKQVHVEQEEDELAKTQADIEAARQEAAEATRRMRGAEDELQRIRAGGLVYDFAGARAQSRDYTGELGIVSTIREDFRHLKELLKEWRQDGDGPIERVILYIDDLDRCHPDCVVKVLQAVHLLLAFDLFTVVVAVDARWLESSLREIYGEKKEFRPYQYLEKIFQIPFTVDNLTPLTFRRLIQDTVVRRSEFGENGEDGEDDVRKEAREPVGTGGGKPTKEVEKGLKHDPMKEDATSESLEGLYLLEWERDFITELHDFVDTPRLAKRLVNIYRLIRVQAGRTGDFSNFVDENQGEYRAVLLLLAMNIGFPDVAGHFLRLLETTSYAGNFLSYLERLEPEEGKEEAVPETYVEEYERLRDAIKNLSEATNIPSGLGTYRNWVPVVGQYSFHWHLA